eukprot:PITA_09349
MEREGEENNSNQRGRVAYCNHCNKEGHDDDHCWKQHPEKCPKKYEGIGKQKIVAAAQQDLGSYSGDEALVTVVGTKGTLFNTGSQGNLIVESLAKKLSLETKPHPKPYPLGWIHDKEKLNVTQQYKVKFVIASKLVDEVEIDVIPLDICGMVLGSPYLYDTKAVFYHITKDGVEYIVWDYQNKINSSLISAGKMKILVNSSKTCMLMVVREKEAEFVDAFQGCDGKHKQELMELISDYNELFQEPKGLPLKREIQHEIHLLHDAPLPNIGVYRMSAIEMEEIKRQVLELLDQGVIRLSSSPCGSPIILVPKKDDSWRMYVDYRVLNKILVKNRYPLPLIDDLLD